ncbi:hypothetical protein BD311DRAFT_141220 [Dichomitus squalens]|uniref:Uncharacterized protein n=1 Tax=Dichomitus squalens TaxID=114155 RepID=A0A4Q9M821_9APHY|nr:hypothetical protein BD311DRAFT_141220 [Dichomitus squalens]
MTCTILASASPTIRARGGRGSRSCRVSCTGIGVSVCSLIMDVCRLHGYGHRNWIDLTDSGDPSRSPFRGEQRPSHGYYCVHFLAVSLAKSSDTLYKDSTRIHGT